MIPTTSTLSNTTVTFVTQPSTTYRMHYEGQHISAYRDKQSAVEQAIYKILLTERYQYAIYSPAYGVELQALFGQPVAWVCPEIERRVTEALLQDDRISTVDGFTFDIARRGVVAVTFTAHTIYGTAQITTEVSY